MNLYDAGVFGGPQNDASFEGSSDPWGVFFAFSKLQIFGSPKEVGNRG